MASSIQNHKITAVKMGKKKLFINNQLFYQIILKTDHHS